MVKKGKCISFDDRTWKLLVKFCVDNHIAYSKVVRMAVNYFLSKGNMVTDKIKKHSKINLFIEEKSFLERKLKVDMGRVFLYHNVGRKLMVAINLCNTKKHLYELISSYKDLASLYEDRLLLRHLNELLRSLKKKKEFLAIKQEVKDYVSLMNVKIEQKRYRNAFEVK